MRLQITREDIELGLRLDPDSCAVARAMKREGYREPLIGTDEMNWTAEDGRVVVWPVSARVRFWISRFDDALFPRDNIPEITIELPDPEGFLCECGMLDGHPGKCAEKVA